jgi:O-antigen biosynthesis protein
MHRSAHLLDEPIVDSLRYSPLKVVDLHIERPLRTLEGLGRYRAVQALVRLHGTPVGWIRVPIHGQRCLAVSQRRAIVDRLRDRLLAQLVQQRLQQPDTRTHNGQSPPAISVAVCTRDRPHRLESCMESLEHVAGPLLEVIVVDNAPTTDATRRLVTARGSPFRYVHEPRAGLDWARNRAIEVARGEVIAFTDDDCIVDALWIESLAQTFAECNDITAVTGLVTPLELETEAQILFEDYGGFGRGFRRRWHRVGPRARGHVGAGNFGTGANMAFRLSTLKELGGFDPALDVGTVTNGGGDLEMFFRVLQEGHTLVYEPRAIVRHAHRRDLEALGRQLTDHGIGFSSYVTRCLRAYPYQWRSFAWFIGWWLRHWIGRRGVSSILRPASFPRHLVWAEARGAAIGLTRYSAARRVAARVLRESVDLDEESRR